MKKVFLTGCAIAAMMTSARADFHAPEPFDGGAFECSVVNEQPRDRDPNPVYKINVNVMLSDMGRITSMGVVHTVRSGKTYDRSEQYSNGTVGQKPGLMEWYWSGRRGDLQMIGTIYHNDRDGWMYREQIVKYGRIQYTMLSDCHEQKYAGDERGLGSFRANAQARGEQR
jgi:hypothetical protein